MQIFHVDAFAAQLFEGNPAAVIPIHGEWPDNDRLQAIAAENNLSETAFFKAEEGHYRLRWFTPLKEVRLCGHATLATAHVLFAELKIGRETIHFETLSGRLSVQKKQKGYQMDFPVDMPRQVTPPAGLQEAFAGRLKHCFRATDDFMVVLSSQEELAQLSPDIKAIAGLESRGLIITAPGEEVDFVSRCFFPRYGIDEDPVTGSAHTVLTPYWAARLGKNKLAARQISARGGELQCKLEGGRVFLTGQAVTYLSGTIFL